MYLIRGINNINLFRAKHSQVSTVATIGTFDGLHLGHINLIDKVLDISNKNKTKSVCR